LKLIIWLFNFVISAAKKLDLFDYKKSFYFIKDYIFTRKENENGVSKI